MVDLLKSLFNNKEPIETKIASKYYKMDKELGSGGFGYV